MQRLTAGNATACHRPRKTMVRATLVSLVSFVALAQPQRDDFQSIYAAYHQARQEGRFGDASAKREQLRRMVETAPADSPQLASWVQMTTQLYEMSGMYA